MDSDTVTIFQLLAPTVFVAGAIYTLGPTLPIQRTWARVFIFCAVWLIVGRYQAWRLFVTVLPAHGAWYEIAWVWFCYLVELFATGDAIILYLTFLRGTDRRAEADVHEARLRATPPSDLPGVDIYIPTYNEPMDVLEKTITGALCIDYPNFQVWVLDDGRRPWLKEFCRDKGVGYLTRPDNAHAKAGNINHALTKTNAPYVAIFDADFIPQQNFLMRTMGFFVDPKIGIVQTPHAFYNSDPMQTNLALRKTLPDDQRFFFEAIMPSRDGWDAAFCCGSNSVTRRTALRTVGDALPTGSITEDMLLTLVLLRQGYITRYLCERLAFGLAPENIEAFFVQRQRWARGGTQIMFLPEGPLGPGLSFIHRLMFLPSHWLSQSCTTTLTVVTPLVFLLTGLTPLFNVTADSVLDYIVPMILALIGGLQVLAPGKYFPFASQVLGSFQSFKILPTVLLTLIKPFGHAFKVTPKGRGARRSSYERGIFWSAAFLIFMTVGGLVLNSMPETRVIDTASLLPVMAIWGVINVVTLFLVCMLSLQAPAMRSEERFAIDDAVGLFGASGNVSTGRIHDISLSGVAISVDADAEIVTQAGEYARVFIREVGFVPGRVVRQNGRFLALQFDLPQSIERDLLISKLFTLGLNTTADVSAASSAATLAILGSILKVRSPYVRAETDDAAPAPPAQKLAAESLVLVPTGQRRRLAEIGAQRRDFAA
ncbi:MAG TPA: glycosyltransferase [Xanthobacteraceae bacterium]